MHHSTKFALFGLFSVVMASGVYASEMKHADMGEMKMASEAPAQQQVISSKDTMTSNFPLPLDLHFLFFPSNVEELSMIRLLPTIRFFFNLQSTTV